MLLMSRDGRGAGGGSGWCKKGLEMVVLVVGQSNTEFMGKASNDTIIAESHEKR